MKKFLKIVMWLCVVAFFLAIPVTGNIIAKRVKEKEAEVAKIKAELKAGCQIAMDDSMNVLQGLKIVVKKTKIDPKKKEAILARVFTIEGDISKCGGEYLCTMATAKETIFLADKYYQLSKK